MSINVTVHGNPISIKKGKMVTYDADSEFEHRRRIRLQQVRQQSKEIAADVRNRVRKEKERHLSQAEQKGEQDLKRWQARKLLALQQQYEDCLKEIGTAHTKAALEPDPNDVLNEVSAKNQVEANIREKIASERNRKESTSKRLELEKLMELKKQTRKMEDERSAMIASLNQSAMKKNKRKKVAADIHIRSNVTESDSSENISDEENISSNIMKHGKKKKQKINIDLTSPERGQISESSQGSSSPSFDLDRIRSRSPTPNNKNRSILTPNTTPTSSKKGNTGGYKKITKISDRIQQRKAQKKERIKKKTDNFGVGKKCGESDEELQMESNEICDIPSETDPKRLSLPHVPTTTLRPDREKILNEQPSKVKYYDHLNRFSKEYVTPPVVQRISKDSVEVHPPSERSDMSEIQQVSNTRDQVAHDRGVRAMEKERMQKDYNQLMKELPLLQKQERLAQMRTHNPAFHMPQDRLEELEKRRQSKIENIFEKYYHKSKTLETPLITIRPIQKAPPNDELKLPFRALDITEPDLQLNVAEWTTENVAQASETDHQGQEQLQERQEALIDLLQRVNKQRELLLQEVSTLPPSSNLHKILQDDQILNLICPCCPEVNQKEVETGKINKSVGTIPQPEQSKISTTPNERTSKSVPVNTSASTDTSTDVKKKKHKRIKKTKKTKIKIRNEETQTSPLLKSSTDSQQFRKPNLICSCKTSTTATSSKCHCDEIIEPPRPATKTCNCDELHMKVSRCPCSEIYKENMQKFGTSEKCPCIEKHKDDKKKSKQVTSKNPYIENYDDVHKLCQIVIKASTEANVEIHKEDEKSDGKRVILNVSKPTKITINSPSNGNDVSSSTTYMSLPKNQQKMSKTKVTLETQNNRQQYKDLLHHKPQQTNINSPVTADSNRKEITPNLLKYIQKLLSMSRQSIDELTVSSISDVSTPGCSVFDTAEDNNPFVTLQNVMNYYNLSVSDIQKHLSASDETNESTEERKTEYAQVSRPKTCNSKDHVDRNTGQREPDAYSSICIVPQNPKSSQPSPATKSPRNYEEVAEIAKETFGLKPDDMKEIPYANIVSKYKDLTKTCCDRITKLTAMIDNVRLEKERLLSPNVSDRYETSVTSYLDLPKFSDSYRSNGNQSARQSNGSSTNSSMSQDAVDRYLLAVDKGSPTGQKKQNSSSRSRKQASSQKKQNISPTSVSTRTTSPPGQRKKRNKSPTDKKKKNSPPRTQKTAGNVDNEIPVSDNSNSSKNNEQPFVPMLQGIPKYSSPAEDQAGNYLNSPIKQFLLNAAKSKPPPSLLRNATKFNLNIDLTPHELSTIAEMDTVVSSRNVSDTIMPRPRSPEDIIPSREDSEASGFMTLNPDQFQPSPPRDQNSPYCDPCGLPRKSSLKQSPRSNSPPQERSLSNAELSGIQPLNSERSTSSPEDMEVMLRNMGLAWAITTLKKTHEALALSSSSSSVEASFRKRVSFKDTSSSSNSSTPSDVSLKNVLSKELMRKISSSSLISNSSGISPNLKEFREVSERDQTDFNRDGSQQRTSTPVMHSKSTDSKKDLFTGDSDISSVRMHSEEFFLSIPNVSLDTNKSLSKSKE